MFNAELQAKIAQYLEDEKKKGVGGVTQIQVGRQLGFTNGSPVSSYIKGDYKGDVLNLEAGLREFFRNLEEKDEHKAQSASVEFSDEYVPTTVSQKVYNAIRYCHLVKGIVAVIGESGVGKTVAAEKYADEHPNSSIYLEVLPSNSSMRNFLRSLCDEMGLPSSGSVYDMRKVILSRLNGLNKVLILDEAQNLPFKTMEEIRNWSEPNKRTGAEGVGIVLIGNEDVEERMNENRKYARQRNRRRFTVRCKTDDTTIEDVRQLFPMFAALECKKELDFIFKVCRSDLGIRGAVNIYIGAAEALKESGRRIDLKTLVAHTRQADALVATMALA